MFEAGTKIDFAISMSKTKYILLLCSGYSLWIILDTLIWTYFEPQRYIFILKYNSSILIFGFIVCFLLVLVHLGIIKKYAIRQFLYVFFILAATLFFSVARVFFNLLIFQFWSSGSLHLQAHNIIPPIFNSFILFLALTGLFYVTYYRNLFLQQKEQIARTKALADEAQLLMLRYQINPHFLFNSLNAIQSMVEKDKERTKEMIADLSDFFRYTLSKNNQTLVPLKEEINAVKKYLAIQKERFAGRLLIDYEIEDTSLEIMLPFFIIHPLVENAIKYGFSSGNDVLRILIRVTMSNRELSILVKNTGAIVTSEKIASNKLTGTKTGIDNIRKRLSLFYPDHSAFDLFEKDSCVNALITITQPGISA